MTCTVTYISVGVGSVYTKEKNSNLIYNILSWK